MRAETAHRLQTVWGIVGFALYWPTLRQFEFAAVLSGYADPAQANRGALLAVLAALAVLCAGAVMLRRRVEHLFARPSAVSTALCCTGTLGALLLTLAPGLGGFEPFAFGLGAVAVALGYVALTMAWASSLLAMEGRSALLVMVIGYALGSLAPFTDLASQGAALGFTLLAPVGSAAAWVLCRPDGAAAGRQPDYSLGSLKRLPLLLVVMIALFLFAGRVTVGAFVSPGAQIALLVRAVDVAVAFGFMVVMLVLIKGKSPEDWVPSIKVAWVLLALVAIAGMLLMLAGLSQYFAVGEGLVAAAFNCFELLLWVLLVRLARERALSVALLVCFVFCICKVVPVFCGKLLAPWMTALAGSPEAMGLIPLLLVLVFLLIAATFVFLAFGGAIWGGGSAGAAAVHSGSEEPPASDAPAVPAPTGPVSEERAQLYGLTPRELEVMGCVLRGYSYQKTADEMGLSLSTVQSHAKNLYRKCGVHTKDELVEWVQGQG